MAESFPVVTVSPVEVRDRTPAAIRADNIIRQRLRIGDTGDAREVAAGLRRIFPKEARSLTAETEGFPILPSRFAPAVARAPESVATGAELKQAIDNCERDLAALTTDHRLKDITPELQGWAQAIRSITSDGMAAARLSLDARSRDRLFAARRQLGDYARLARLIGALTQTMNASYRRLAQSLDEVAAFMITLAGEALASAGLGGGRFLPSVPASEMQARRDAVLLALRTLTGTTEVAYGNDQWPWGLHGFREVLQRVNDSGHLELRALLEEPVLGRMMDELIERAAQQNIHGLRALGATAEVAVQRLYRLLHIIDDNVNPESPPVMTFLKAIQLFLDGFRSSRSGYRLLYVARAPIAYSGFGSFGGPDVATRRLIDMIILRGRLAELLDCYLGCECCNDDMLCQIILDRLLYDTDRAIDLYTLGADPSGDGEPEWRAAAYGAVIDRFITVTVGIPPVDPQHPRITNCFDAKCFPRAGEIQTALAGIRELLWQLKITPPPTPANSLSINALDQGAARDLLTDELCLQQLSDQRLEALIATLAPGCIAGQDVLDRIKVLIDAAIRLIDPAHGACTEVEIAPPPTTPSSLRIFHDINPFTGGFRGMRGQ